MKTKRYYRKIDLEAHYNNPLRHNLEHTSINILDHKYKPQWSLFSDRLFYAEFGFLRLVCISVYNTIIYARTRQVGTEKDHDWSFLQQYLPDLLTDAHDKSTNGKTKTPFSLPDLVKLPDERSTFPDTPP